MQVHRSGQNFCGFTILLRARHADNPTLGVCGQSQPIQRSPHGLSTTVVHKHAVITRLCCVTPRLSPDTDLLQERHKPVCFSCTRGTTDEGYFAEWEPT